MYLTVRVEPLSIKRLNLSVLLQKCRVIGEKNCVSQHTVYPSVIPIMLPFLVLISRLTYALQLSITLILCTLNFTVLRYSDLAVWDLNLIVRKRMKSGT